MRRYDDADCRHKNGGFGSRIYGSITVQTASLYLLLAKKIILIKPLLF
jgi:hypothetical protein